MIEKIKVLFHIDRNDEETLILSLNNIRNFIEEANAENYTYEIILLANYKAPLLFLKNNINKNTLEFIKNLKEKGVKVLICEKSMKSLKITKEELIDECEITPSGVFTIAKLEKLGFAYIKP
ncbi:hypothetical protein Calag_0525 [Caldisphaera lagunensis DSM 15908]|uniref:Uncharacterized protein n=1 Tax=Caldisphaera lagunensis (strain DSM 15908 / JCM 11604 / ANMR 0165 / IC-154) TaxID=1056495 RepID=L0AAY2_CALLD|nr:DsrE family protein [Caldisphaera lagunensis]AFZ70287.1 hypothetical protein Calag_0525 [Caldisphaera lagunensis DSM 15908]